jgi:hypothetical protein
MMPLPRDTSIRELIHQLRLVQGVEDRQADLMRQVLAVRARQAARVREIARLVEDTYRLQPDAHPPNSVKPLEFDPGQAVWSLRIGDCPDSSIWFEFDDTGAWFFLGARLAGLLRFLSFEEDNDRGKDELVDFRSRPEILAYLEKTSGGRKYDPQFVNKMAHKLRGKLRLYDKRLLIASNKEGIRFMVRRGAAHLVRLDRRPDHLRGGSEPPRPRAPPGRSPQDGPFKV